MNIESTKLELLTKLTANRNSRLSRISAKPANGESLGDERKKKLKQACHELEGLFLSELLKSMRKTVPESGLLGKGFAHKTYREMFDKELVKQMSHSNGMGLGQVLYRQLIEAYDDDKI